MISFDPGQPFNPSESTQQQFDQLSADIATANRRCVSSGPPSQLLEQLRSEIALRKRANSILDALDVERIPAIEAAGQARDAAAATVRAALQAAGLPSEAIETAITAHPDVAAARDRLTRVYEYTTRGVRQVNHEAIDRCCRQMTELQAVNREATASI